MAKENFRTIHTTNVNGHHIQYAFMLKSKRHINNLLLYYSLFESAYELKGYDIIVIALKLNLLQLILNIESSFCFSRSTNVSNRLQYQLSQDSQGHHQEC